MANSPSEVVSRISAFDPRLADEVAGLFDRLVRAGEATVWAQEHIGALIAADAPDRALQVVVSEARALTGAPIVWALRWSGDPAKAISFRALASAGAADGVPSPDQVSASVIGQVIREGRPAWSDDAAADARFGAAQSVVRWSLRSVGCLALGRSAVLYLADPHQPGRFAPEVRARLGALCRLAAPFVDRVTARPPPRVVEPLDGLVGASPAMGELFDAVRAFAPMPWPVLILGETGVGKERVAAAIHALSSFASQPFVAVNCGAIPDTLAESALFGHERGAFTGADRPGVGVIERAGNGTLFLDEVGELSATVQVKLLRLLQEGTWERVGGARTNRFTGRIVAATHRPLDGPESVASFRDDLYYRLAACVVHVPPLRERPGDVELLAHHLLDAALAELPGRPRLALSERASEALSRRAWPGNVRELQNAIRGGVARALSARSATLEPAHLPTERGAQSDAQELPGNLQAATDAFQKARVLAAIEASGGNRSDAARQLGVSRQWLHRLLARWGTA